MPARKKRACDAPFVVDFAVERPRPMEEPDILARVSSLEQEVKALKASLDAEAKPVGLTGRSQKLARFLIANWVLLSFVSGLLVAGYVKIKFDIDPLESYRAAADKRELSK